jgi:DNA-binding NarL/FixJ family response regulator
LVRQVENLRPDVVLLELESLDDEGKESLLTPSGTPSTLLDAVPMVVLVEDLDGSATRELLSAGVRAVLPLNSSSAQITAAVEAAAAGLIVLHSDTADSLVPAVTLVPQTRPAPGHPTLTQREIEVLRMLAEGLGNKLIADRLGVSEHTVKFHIASIFNKLEVANRTEAVTAGLRRGLIMI